MNIQTYITQIGQRARAASRIMASASTAQKNQALLLMAKAIEDNQQTILDANATDLQNGKNRALDSALMDRLELNPSRIQNMIESLHQVASLPDPIGAISHLNPRPSGIQVGQMRVPLGVIGIIYESRPNVTSEAASLCLKTGNPAILRGGSEAIESNRAIGQCIQSALEAAGLPIQAIQVVETTDRAAVGELIQRPEYVDVIIPRGGKGLIARISEEARVPVIKHLDGNCHVYIDEFADPQQAIDIALNAKTQRYGTCNTMETLLIHEAMLSQLLPPIAQQLKAKGVEIRACARTRQNLPDAKAATEEDWFTEYLAPVLAIKTLDSLEQAITHINHYGSHHTDAIVTQNHAHAMRFLREVDSSSVMVNASTRFADGFEYGLGAEIGISTDKFHARGPVGLKGLTSQKYVVLGQGNVRP